MTERRQQAWDEAQRRYATRDRQAGFVSGAAWADGRCEAGRYDDCEYCRRVCDHMARVALSTAIGDAD